MSTIISNKFHVHYKTWKVLEKDKMQNFFQTPKYSKWIEIKYEAI